jgi:hypothetical protein
MNKIFFLTLFFFSIVSTIFSQKGDGLAYGIEGGLQFNSAILPDIALNTSIESVLAGDEVAKGVPQWADLTLNHKLGAFAKYDHGFGFVLFETQYTTTTIKKDIKFTTSDFWGHIDVTLATLKEKYAYLDFSLSYNVYVYNNLYVGLGATPAFLVSNTSDQEPNKSDFRVFGGLGYHVNNQISVATRVELGISEVYEGSYIHHLMIPLSIRYTIN